MSWSSSWYVTTLPSLVAIGIVVIGICFYLIPSSSKTFKVSHHPAKFGGQGHCSSGNIMDDHWVEYVYGWKLLKVNHHPTIFGSHRHCGIGDIMVLPWSQ